MTQQQDIFEFFCDLLTDMKDLGDHVIRPTDSFRDLDLDSLDFVQIQVEVQKAYGVQVPTDEIADGSVSTLEQLAALIANEAQALAEVA
jgi:acyl carrier protein